MQWCQTHILPMVREANISYNLIQTGKMYAHKAKLKLAEMNMVVDLSEFLG